MKTTARPASIPAAALRVPRLSKRQAAKERASKAAEGLHPAGRFNPRQYALRVKARSPAPADDAAGGIAESRIKLTPTINPPPMRPLVLARPQVRAGGEDYRQHPSRLTPQQREAYWVAPQLPAGDDATGAPKSHNHKT